MVEVVSKTKHSKTKTEARKTRKRSTQISKTKDAKRETCLPFITHETVPCQVTNADTAGIKHNLTNRMQVKTVHVELRGVANAIPPPWLNLKSDEDFLFWTWSKCFTMATVFTRPVLELRFRNYPVVEYLPDSKCSDLFCSWHILRKKSVVMFYAKKIPCVITVCW